MTEQIVTETNKALDIVSTTTVRNAHSAQDILNKQKQVELISQQVLKLTEDTAFVGEQKTQLTASVGFNNKLKTLNSYGNMIGTMGAGGLVISDDMWVVFFDMIKGLNSNVSGVPSNTTVVKKT